MSGFSHTYFNYYDTHQELNGLFVANDIKGAVSHFKSLKKRDQIIVFSHMCTHRTVSYSDLLCLFENISPKYKKTTLALESDFRSFAEMASKDSLAFQDQSFKALLKKVWPFLSDCERWDTAESYLKTSNVFNGVIPDENIFSSMFDLYVKSKDWSDPQITKNIPNYYFLIMDNLLTLMDTDQLSSLMSEHKKYFNFAKNHHQLPQTQSMLLKIELLSEVAEKFSKTPSSPKNKKM